MTKRWIGYGVWLLLTACLYFFENNTGTRVVLFCTALMPFIPPLRSAFFAPGQPARDAGRKAMTVRTFLRYEPDEPGEIRAYRPGDPIRRIHWKLSAKKDELLVRDGAAPAEAAAEAQVTPRDAGQRKAILRRPWAAAAAAAFLFALLLLVIPEARLGLQALCNRLFAESEARNAYIYEYFPVSPQQRVVPAAALLLCAAVSLGTLALIAPSPLPAFGCMAACTLFQVYFGLAFPAWVNVPLYGLFAIRMMRRPFHKKSLTTFLALLLICSLSAALLLPGVDAGTEALSEQVRDRLSRITAGFADGPRETAESETETRHIHTRSLENGEREAETAQEFRLETAEEEQISMPRWLDWMRIILLFALSVLLFILPFAPFLLLNARRKKAREARKVFSSENVREAVQAVFRQVVLWLETADRGGGNLLYRDWADRFPDSFPQSYADRFARCAADYEESLYSDHPMTEEQRRNALRLLEETEKAVWKTANRRQRFRLKYWECLYI